MAYLGNRTVNLLNLHYGMHMLVMNGAGVFWYVFLLKAGIPVPVVIAVLGLIVSGRFLLRPLIALIGPRVGLRPLAIAGTLLVAVQYPVLGQVQGLGWTLAIACAMASIGDTFYWTSYHAYFASLGDEEHRGHQIGIREAISGIASIVAPIVGGWALVVFGSGIAFGAAGILMALGALPFLATPDVPVAKSAPGVIRMALPAILLFAADGWMAACLVIVWQVALFQSLGGSFTSYGGAMAIAATVGAAASLLLGRYIDAGHGRRASWPIYIALALLVLFEAVSTRNPAMAVATNAWNAVVVSIYVPILMTAVYNRAKRSPCPLRFHIATEGGWDIGAASASFIAAGLSAAGWPLAMCVLVAIPGVILSFVVLRGSYPQGVIESSLPMEEVVDLLR